MFNAVVLSIQEDLKRVEEAEIASHRAMDTAIKMRSKVQILMTNADLATYKADMAVRIAEAIKESCPSDLIFSVYS